LQPRGFDEILQIFNLFCFLGYKLKYIFKLLKLFKAAAEPPRETVKFLKI